MKAWNAHLTGGADGRSALRGGSYSAAVSALALAILVAVNMFVSALPAALTKYDISASKLYSVTSNNKVVVNAPDQDVTIYWVVQAGAKDEIIENLLSKYESLSDHLRVEKKEPGRLPYLCPTVYGRNRTEQQPHCGVRQQKPVHQHQ